MLFAAEGGGFFSSSASGYSKGLALLLLGQKNDERHLRVSSWNHYQLVGQDPETDFQVASFKNRFSCGCASFICPGRASAGVESPSSIRVGPAQLDKGKDHATRVDDNGESATKIELKSSLKKRQGTVHVHAESANDHTTSGGDSHEMAGHMERRKVHWTDACGNQLAEIREFEPSETGSSDDELESGNVRSCACRIM